MAGQLEHAAPVVPTVAGPSEHAEATRRPPPGQPRFPRVDAVRGMAALSVLVFHVGSISGANDTGALGFVGHSLNSGVTLFFLVSGFLLYRPFVAARVEGRPRPSAITFFRRRLLRIVPAYWVALTVLTLVFSLPGVFTADWWRYYGFVQIYDLSTFDKGMGVAWTLCIEMSFYLVLPLLAIGLARAVGRAVGTVALRRELLVLALLALATLVFDWWVVASGHDERRTQTLPGTFEWFAIGMALAVVQVHRPTMRLGRPGAVWAAAAGLYLLAAALRPSEHGAVSDVVLDVVFGLVSLLVLLPAVAESGGWVARTMSSRAFAWVGLVSFSLYLYHATLVPPLIDRGVETRLPGDGYVWLLAATLVLSFVVAAGSYYCVERPALRLRDLSRIGRRRGERVAS